MANLVSRLLGEDFFPQRGAQQMRFDCDARVEVFIDQEELEEACEALKAGAGSVETKIAQAKEIALSLARDKVEVTGGGVQVTADVSLSNVNIDNIDWVTLVSPDEQTV